MIAVMIAETIGEMIDPATGGMEYSMAIQQVREMTGATYDWGQFNYLELDPYREPAHVFTVSFGRAVQFPPPVA